MLLPVSLTTAAALAVLALWLSIRIGQVRRAAKISHGDGGHPLLARRMRAQLNFVESAPFVFALALAIETAGKGGEWLAFATGAYVLGRVAHAIGMDGEAPTKARMIGTIVTMLTLLGLAVVALLTAIRVL